jgi:NADH dehydrogenase [ubiquinone] 1 alpha subcomplex assembly factor 7
MKTVAQFMQDAMYDEKNGYYISANPIGKSGDFITAPEISQLFGEMMGVYCYSSWIRMGKPTKFNLVELGPGRATLMLDLHRATKHIEEFSAALKIHLVETNQNHIEIQKKCLEGTWHLDISTLPNDLPMIIIANEFFDCLPIHQYIFKNNKWHERYIEDKKFFDIPIKQESNYNFPKVFDGAIVEVCYQAGDIVKQLCHYFDKVAGSLLIIDYGYEHNNTYISTLQALKNHQYHSIFADVGQADLTAHIDFGHLKKIALANGCLSSFIMTQREFLLSLGIDLRAEILKKNASAAQKKDIDSGLYRLIDKKEMGELFKVISIDSTKNH